MRCGRPDGKETSMKKAKSGVGKFGVVQSGRDNGVGGRGVERVRVTGSAVFDESVTWPNVPTCTCSPIQSW